MRVVHVSGISLIAALLSVAAAAAAPRQSDAPTSGQVQQLYAAAEYEQALALLGSSTEPDAHLYRALCLLALGRHNESALALQSLILSSPDFTVSSEEVPPRVVTMLTEVRREVLPAHMRRLFADARALYHAKAYDRAVSQFELVIRLASLADVRALEGVADLRVLSEGFVDLAKAPQLSAPPPAATPVSAPQPSRVAVPPTTTTPVAIKQEMPPWPSDISSTRMAAGAVRVQISATGAVTSASMVRGINPQYDLRVLAAARSWQYTPATMNGKPVPSESVVEIRLNR
jgi:hypothetical protein